MDTSRLKTFAQNARDIIKEGVKYELQKKGFDAEGNVLFEPSKLTGGTLFDGEILEPRFYDQWMALRHKIESRGLEYVYEETAYTWFNRLIALQILSKNKIINEPVLMFTDEEHHIPFIVDEARNGRWSGIDEEAKERVSKILNDYTKTAEQFAILVSSYCRNNPIISRCFGGIDDYTEILLPSNILSAGNFICMLNDTPYITDDDYKKTELLGWMYQFYISKKKDAVNKQTEWSADDVPAGTQIFTPNWIVKYMVENTLGRIYLDNNENVSFNDDMKYLVEPCEGERPIFHYGKLQDLKCADISCGSGHILNEFFDLLLKCYEEEAWDSTSAIEEIFKHNIVGIDLDTRAQQLSMFSLLLKACLEDKDAFKDAHILPHVLDMPDVKYDTCIATVEGLFADYEENIKKEVREAFKLVENANELGSIMKFDLCEDSRKAIADVLAKYGKDVDAHSEILKSMDLMLVLSDKYGAICMNPPYMGRKHMDKVLKNYVDKNYQNSKSDLFAVFMDVAIDRLAGKAKYGMINMQSWMFLSSFEELRCEIIDNQSIDSLLHLGPHTFDELSGEVVQNATFVISKYTNENSNGSYFRLVNGKNCSEKQNKYLNFENQYRNIYQAKFNKLPGTVIGYWLKDKEYELFRDLLVRDIAHPCKGIDTGENEYFLRLWSEINPKEIDDSDGCGKWVPYNKGGGFRKWFGNREYLLRWNGSDSELRLRLTNRQKRPTLRNSGYWFKESFTWCTISTNAFSARFSPKGAMFDSGGNSVFSETHLKSVGALLNSVVSSRFFEFLAPTINFQAGDIGNVAYSKLLLNQDKEQEINSIVNCNIDICKQDWDAHETSWDFKRNPLIEQYMECMEDDLQNVIPFGSPLEVVCQYAEPSTMHPLSTCLHNFKEKWEVNFMRLHDNEEELNRQFIEIYGLQDELTPDVPLDEITILQQGEKKIENGKLVWNEDVLIKQLISYAMGCWMGRYRLDKPGLNIAHPDPTPEELASYTAFGHKFEIDDDGIIPLLPRDSPFYDNAINRWEDFVKGVFGEEHFTDNWNLMTSLIGKAEDYFFKPSGFWKDHKTMYQKTPIYWLFSSEKGYFKCIAYMHRMTKFTVRDIRDRYLLKYIDFLHNMIQPLEANEASLNGDDKKKLAYYQKAFADCKAYDLLLNNVAQKFIDFDLDDGVKKNYAKFGKILATI